MRFWGLGFVFLLILISNSFAEKTLTGRNYRLVVSDKHADYVRPIRQFLNKADSSYEVFFGGIGLSRQRYSELTVYAYPSRKEFDGARRKSGVTGRGLAVAAYYSPRLKTAFVYDAGDLDITLSSLLHEISHHYIREHIPEKRKLSPCLDEGLAELVDSSPMRGTNMKVSPVLHMNWAKQVRQAALNNQLIPIEELLSMRISQFQGLSARTNALPYAQCWAFARFLLNDLDGRWRPILLALLTEVPNRQVFGSVLQGALPDETTLEEFMQAWKQFARKPS